MDDDESPMDVGSVCEPDGRVRVLSEQCATCIFRPGNLMHLRRGRLADIVRQCQTRDTNVVCHSTLPAIAPDGVKPAFCRGHVERYGDGNFLRVVRRLAALTGRAAILELPPPPARKDNP